MASSGEVSGRSDGSRAAHTSSVKHGRCGRCACARSWPRADRPTHSGRFRAAVRPRLRPPADSPCMPSAPATIWSTSAVTSPSGIGHEPDDHVVADDFGQRRRKADGGIEAIFTGLERARLAAAARLEFEHPRRCASALRRRRADAAIVRKSLVPGGMITVVGVCQRAEAVRRRA